MLREACDVFPHAIERTLCTLMLINAISSRRFRLSQKKLQFMISAHFSGGSARKSTAIARPFSVTAKDAASVTGVGVFALLLNVVGSNLHRQHHMSPSVTLLAPFSTSIFSSHFFSSAACTDAACTDAAIRIIIGAPQGIFALSSESSVRVDCPTLRQQGLHGAVSAKAL